MRPTRWAPAAVPGQLLEDDAPFGSLLSVHPDWPFDNASGANTLRGAGPTDFDRVVVEPLTQRLEEADVAIRAGKKPYGRVRGDGGRSGSGSEVRDRAVSDRVLDEQIARLSPCNRAKLNRYAAQELRWVPHFEADEGSAAWGCACRSVMRKLHACGQTLDDIEQEM